MSKRHGAHTVSQLSEIMQHLVAEGLSDSPVYIETDDTFTYIENASMATLNGNPSCIISMVGLENPLFKQEGVSTVRG